MPVHAVRTEQKCVALHERNRLELGLDLRFDTERTVDGVLLAAQQSLIVREPARAKQVFDIGVIVGLAMKARSVEAIDATVAGVPDYGLLRRHTGVQQGNRSAHAEVLVRRERSLEDVAVGISKGILEDVLHVVRVVAAGVTERLLDRVDCKLARHFAARMTAYAVAYDEQTAVDKGERAVFIDRPFRAEASVADKCGVELHESDNTKRRPRPGCRRVTQKPARARGRAGARRDRRL